MRDEATEEPLSWQARCVLQARSLVESLRSILTATECNEVLHLIEHDEIGEAMRALAWIIVEEDKRIPRAAYESILDLSAGLVASEHMPESLAARVDGAA